MNTIQLYLGKHKKDTDSPKTYMNFAQLISKLPKSFKRRAQRANTSLSNFAILIGNVTTGSLQVKMSKFYG